MEQSDVKELEKRRENALQFTNINFLKYYSVVGSLNFIGMPGTVAEKAQNAATSFQNVNNSCLDKTDENFGNFF